MEEDVLIGVESEPVKRGNGMDSGTGSVLISSGRETRWLGETCLGFSGSLSDCSGSVDLTCILPFRKKSRD